ncbi:MAG TPA: hypothetical protein VFP80_15840 [Thermoanaerobaculia bacterium]|nr:hypothetical protein [Thermoanaerobaculia bacterium]
MKKQKKSKKRSSGRTTKPVPPAVKREASPKDAATSAATDAPVPSTTPEFKAGRDL